MSILDISGVLFLPEGFALPRRRWIRGRGPPFRVEKLEARRSRRVHGHLDQRWLDGGENRAAQRLRERDWGEIRFWIQVVLAAFVDHAQLMVCRGGAIGHNLVDLAPLKRNLVALISQAEDKQASRGHN